jgi:hypothetical protein
MTSAVILPSIGPPPPGLKRPDVPDNLKPKLAGSAEGAIPAASLRAQTPEGEAAAAPRGYLSGNTQNLGGSAAVSIQVEEGRIPETAPPEASSEAPKLPNELSEDERAAVSDLKARDREVRSHEAAHAATGQGYAGSPQFEYVRGPDGAQYAVGGHVSIDVSAVPDNPEATIEKMRIVKAAALAPARPSGQDRAVAAQADATIRQAEADLNAKRQEELEAATGRGDEAETAGSAQNAASVDVPTSSGFAFALERQPAGGVADANSLRRPLTGGGLNLIA